MQRSRKRKFDLGSLVGRLEELARKADEKAKSMGGVDNLADVYYQGQRNAFKKAAELVEKELKKTA